MQLEYTPVVAPLAGIHARADSEDLDERNAVEDIGPYNEKTIFQEFLRRFDLSLRESQWGRVVRAFPESIQKPQPIPGEILETLVGHVDAILNGNAFVTLRSPTNEILTGRYPAAEMAKYGIFEGSRFECSTIRLGPTSVQIRFRALESLSGTKEALRQVQERLNLELDDDLFREDP